MTPTAATNCRVARVATVAAALALGGCTDFLVGSWRSTTSCSDGAVVELSFNDDLGGTATLVDCDALGARQRQAIIEMGWFDDARQDRRQYEFYLQSGRVSRCSWDASVDWLRCDLSFCDSGQCFDMATTGIPYAALDLQRL